MQYSILHILKNSHVLIYKLRSRFLLNNYTKADDRNGRQPDNKLLRYRFEMTKSIFVFFGR